MLNIDVSVKNLCLLFIDQSDCAEDSTRSLLLLFDALVKISSSSCKEAMEASVPTLKALTCEKLMPQSIADNQLPLVTCRVCPSATHIRFGNLRICYRLEKKRDFPRKIVCPEVPEADLTRLHASGLELMSKRRAKKPKQSHYVDSSYDRSHRVVQWRWEFSSDSHDQSSTSSTNMGTKHNHDGVTMLVRDIQLLSSPISIYISETESQILVQWCIHSICTLFPTIFGGVTGHERDKEDHLASISASLQKRRSMRTQRSNSDEMKYLSTQFREFDISGDGFLEYSELKSIIGKILAPLNLLTHEIDQKVRDILYTMDPNLGT